MACSRSNPADAISLMACPTGFPVAPTSDRMRRSARPALLPRMPLFANTANMAVVSSIDTPAAFATGATYCMEFENASMDRAEFENDAAMMSDRCAPWSMSFPNARSVDETTSAAWAKSLSVAWAKAKIFP